MPCSAPFSMLSARSTCFRQISGMHDAHVEGGPFEGLDFWKEFFLLRRSTNPHCFHFFGLWDLYRASLEVAT